MSGFADRWRGNSDRYADDITLFADDQWVVRNMPVEATIGPDQCIVLTDFQREILGTMFARDKRGKFGFDEFIYSTRKKSGKSEVEGIVGEWLALFEPGLPEIFTVGNDKEQSRSRAFNTIRQQVAPERATGLPRNPVIAKMLRPMRDSIETSDGGFIKTVAVDFAGEAGADPTASLWDELWGVDRETQRRLWDEFTPSPTRLNSIRFVATYAGFIGESELLHELYERIVGGDRASERKKRRIHPTLPLYVSKDGRSIAFWDDGPASASVTRLPWQTQAYYDAERARLRKSAFERLHENKWVSAETNFITAEQYDALATYKPDGERPRGPVYLGIDAAHKRDSTTAVAWEYVPFFAPGGMGRMFRLVDYRIWLPRPGQVVLPEETAELWVDECFQRGYDVRGISWDPNHFESSGERIRRKYRNLAVRDRLRPYIQSVANLTKLGSFLYDGVRYRQFIVIAGANDFREHFLNANAVDTGVGFRLVKGASEAKKIDSTIASGEALLMASEFGPTDYENPLPIYIGGADDDYEDEF